MTDVSPSEFSPVHSHAMTDPEAGEHPPIVARAGRYYRNMRYLMTLALIGFAAAFAYDGFVAWPARNVAIAETNQALATASTDEAKAQLDRRQHDLGAPKTDTDIALQKALAFALPALAIGYLIFVLRRSRGEIRLEDNVLYVPGYAPIPLSSVTSVDSTLWKKKGIAFVKFTDGGKEKSLRMDDFIYQQKPIDAIYDRLSPPAVS